MAFSRGRGMDKESAGDSLGRLERTQPQDPRPDSRGTGGCFIFGGHLDLRAAERAPVQGWFLRRSEAPSGRGRERAWLHPAGFDLLCVNRGCKAVAVRGGGAPGQWPLACGQTVPMFVLDTADRLARMPKLVLASASADRLWVVRNHHGAHDPYHRHRQCLGSAFQEVWDATLRPLDPSRYSQVGDEAV